MRTAPDILLSTGSDTGKPQTKVLVAKGLFVVLYEGKPFNLTTDRRPADQPVIYQRTCYVSRKPAENLATKLNTIFDVDGFSVVDVELD
ncbi:hypothetical protein [Rhizobium sp. Root482]|uniref:hypothetical protein n=1 Tax=Rhizobium sp. Root482 TaxID=1736543 RepID=UPI0006F20E6D|nr:hypothetical protein [Rhizobium sp. Root482]KQY14435.1 hypothetical protein ASD31_09215 [Rhizobium sp. Root482]